MAAQQAPGLSPKSPGLGLLDLIESITEERGLSADPAAAIPGLKAGREAREHIRKPRRAARHSRQLEEDALDAVLGRGKMDLASALAILGYEAPKTPLPRYKVERALLDRRLRQKQPGRVPDWRRRMDVHTQGFEAYRKFQHDRCGICGKHHIKVGGLRLDMLPDGTLRGLLCRACLRDVDLVEPRVGYPRSAKWRRARQQYVEQPPAQRLFGVLLQDAEPLEPPGDSRDPQRREAIAAAYAQEVEDRKNVPRIKAFGGLSQHLAQALYDLCNPHSRGWKNACRTWSYKLPLTMKRLSALRLVHIDAWPEGGGVVTATEAGSLLAKFLVERS